MAGAAPRPRRPGRSRRGARAVAGKSGRPHLRRRLEVPFHHRAALVEGAGLLGHLLHHRGLRLPDEQAGFHELERDPPAPSGRLRDRQSHARPSAGDPDLDPARPADRGDQREMPQIRHPQAGELCLSGQRVPFRRLARPRSGRVQVRAARRIAGASLRPGPGGGLRARRGPSAPRPVGRRRASTLDSRGLQGGARRGRRGRRSRPSVPRRAGPAPSVGEHTPAPLQGVHDLPEGRGIPRPGAQGPRTLRGSGGQTRRSGGGSPPPARARSRSDPGRRRSPPGRPLLRRAGSEGSCRALRTRRPRRRRRPRR